MMRLLYRSVVIACVMCILPFIGYAQFERENRIISFNPVPTGLASSLVYEHWMKDPEYKDFTDFMKSPPHYMIAQGDLNGDGVDEIFARHSNSDLDYCPNFGEECRLHIYRVNAQGELEEIGRMYSSQNIIVLHDTKQGYHTLRIMRANENMVDYEWNGTSYQEK